MSYKRSDSDSFGEYQLGEGFGAAVHGDINKTDKIAKWAQRGAESLPAGLQGLAGMQSLKGYTGYPSSLQEFPQFADDFGDNDNGGKGEEDPNPTAQALKSVGLGDLKGYETYEGYEGYESFADSGSFAGFEGVEDDAFAGYTLGASMKAVSTIAKRSADRLDVDEFDDDDAGFDGYGTLAGTPEESFHTYFHRASMAGSGDGLIKELAKAVKTIDSDTSMAVRKQYYDLAKEMIIRRKKTNLRHLDIQRAEIESNIGWLINPALPKSGGFNAVLRKAIGTVGAKLGKGGKDDIKAHQAMAVGRRAKADWARAQGLSGFDGFGEGSKLKYLGLGIVGIVIACIVCKLLKAKDAAPARKKSRRKRK